MGGQGGEGRMYVDRERDGGINSSTHFMIQFDLLSYRCIIIIYVFLWYILGVSYLYAFGRIMGGPGAKVGVGVALSRVSQE